MQDESGGERLQPDGPRPDKPVEHIDMALRHVQHTVRVMSDLRAWAVATDKDGTDLVGGPCVWTCERDFEAVVEELRRVQLEAEIYKRRLATTEGRLELVLSAIGRMVTTLPRGSATTFAETP